MEDDNIYPEIEYHQKSKKIYNFTPYENERLMRIALNEIEHKGFIYEMIFRMIDKDYKGAISKYQHSFN